MEWKGKAIGAGVGTVIAGPVGTAIGGWVGHLFDNDAEDRARLEAESEAASRAEMEALLAIFAVLVSAAHVDGVIHHNERRRLKTIADGLFGGGSEHEVDRWIDDIHTRRFTAAECAEVARSLPEAARPWVVRDLFSVFCADDDFSPTEARWMEEFLFLADVSPALWTALLKCFTRQSSSAAERNQHLARLGLSAEAGPEEIRRAYRQLASDFHPDRHQSVPRPLRELAENRLKEINEAYGALTRSPQSARLPDHAALNPDGFVLEVERLTRGTVTLCALCQTRNRLPLPEHHVKARCGACFALLVLPRALLDSLKGS